MVTQVLSDYQYIYLITGAYMALVAIFSVLTIKETFVLKLEDDFTTKILRRHCPTATFETNFSKEGKKLPIRKYLVKPYKILFTHVAFWVSLYGCLAFGIMYMSVSCMPAVVARLYGWDPAKSSLFNLSQFVGIIFGAFLNIGVNKAYRQHTDNVKKYGARWKPEIRLFTMIVGGILLPIGFFILWQAQNVNWVGVAASQVISGAGFFTIFQSALNYVIDTHGHNSASAVSATTLLRSIAAGSMPLLATFLLDTVGLKTFAMILICVSTPLALLPIFMFFTWDKARARSGYVLKYPQ